MACLSDTGSSISKPFSHIKKRHFLIISLLIIILTVFIYPTFGDTSYTSNDWVYINTTSAEDLNQSLIEWGDSSGYTNISMLNSSKTNWYKNITSLSDYAYNYTIFSQNLSYIWSQSAINYVTVDTISSKIDFVYPTPDDNDYNPYSYTYINTTITDTHNTTSFIDWDNSLVAW
ncbi:MAG: hypothetical protein KAJ54_01105, partial [Candidatus Aenigmarchaeota archaeon]|nr:hypothetical protein [Candidatus Aenigmarchaeota archaeon]